MRAAGQRMAALIDDLLKLARIGQVAIRRQPVDLSALAEAVAAELARGDPARDVRFAIAPGIAGEGDAGLLRIVLENLLGNAWKYSRNTAMARIEFGATEDRDRRTFFVRDNGAGFDMSLAHKLFTPFQRLHSGERFPGSGIGLATVQRIVARHQGAIWADSAVGAGATFFWTLWKQDPSSTV
jgi:light-regulated signal transduction histidine kinase (bacteriophytochrome)